MDLAIWAGCIGLPDGCAGITGIVTGISEILDTLLQVFDHVLNVDGELIGRVEIKRVVDGQPVFVIVAGKLLARPDG